VGRQVEGGQHLFEHGEISELVLWPLKSQTPIVASWEVHVNVKAHCRRGAEEEMEPINEVGALDVLGTAESCVEESNLHAEPLQVRPEGGISARVELDLKSVMHLLPIQSVIETASGKRIVAVRGKEGQAAERRRGTLEELLLQCCGQGFS
jgi:hypothetical protein